MESKVIFHEGQDVGPSDFNNLQDFAQRSLDHVVGDGLTATPRYAGFATSKTGPTTIRVAPGRLYAGGPAFLRQDEYTRDFTTVLPVAGKKIVSIVTWGVEQETASAPREFLVNEETGETEPRVVPMEKARVANLNTVIGVEAPDPSVPLIDAGYTEIARAVLTPTGVESVSMVTERALPNLALVDGRVGGLEAFRSEAEPQLSSLATNLAKLTASVSGMSNQALVLRMAYDVAKLKDKAGIPDTRIDYGADHFLNLSETDATNLNLLCKVEEGVRFGPDAIDERQLQVFDALNPRHIVSGGVLLPAFEKVKRLTVGPRTGELSIAQYQYQTHEMRQLTRTRERIRYGEEYTVCTNSAWWQSGQYDPVKGVFEKDGETFEVGWDVNAGWGFNDANGSHFPMRVRRYWVDTIEEPYWDRITIDHSVAGAQVSETFLNGQDGWLTGIHLRFTRLAADGAVHIALMESERGAPDNQRVIAVASVNRADLKLDPEETLIPLPPTYLEAGKRYAFTVTTTADHWLAVTDGGNYGQGTLFYSTDGAYQQGDLTKDICFALQFAQFHYPRVVIDMQPLQLGGGITAIDILADTVAPGSTSITYEVQVGSVWHPLAAVDQTALVGLPPLLPLRMVFVGTTDMMPGVALSGSRVRVSRPRTSFKHISTPRTLPAPAKTIQVKVRFEYFEAGYHTADCKLLTGAGFATSNTATAVSELQLPSESAVERTYTFALAAAVPSYKIELTGTTSTALKTYHVAERVDIALN